ncbi:MAG TPA: DUF480 domain-containing protein [Dermatophilaceae bacterium]|nr:DUF480 domain-containing protein [Dermatophilaceae bacterium]
MPDDPIVLTPAEQRVVGALLEKQITVPGSYPLSLNGLRTACNQTSSREPVTAYTEEELREILKPLRLRDLVRVVHGDRTLKYHQLVVDRLALEPDERALVTVLLLRGPQSAGELKTRAERLHPFADRAEVESCLSRLASADPPLVEELPRQPGQHDTRWVHLLGPVERPQSASPTTLLDRDVVLADGAEARDAKVRAAYDAVAAAYLEQLGDELDGKPFDRWLLTRVAELAGADPVVDAGCGPGQVTAFLAAQGAQVTGVDLSPRMIEVARERFSGNDFEVGDLRTLMRPRAASGWGAVVCWYAVVHLAGSELAGAVAGLTRTLQPGGWLALATHVGEAIHHADELMGQPVDLDVVLHDPEQVRTAVTSAGLELVEWYLRGPLEGVEVATERLYLLARRSS